MVQVDAAVIGQIRNRCRGKWLWFTGDSTLRGLYFALWHQLVFRLDGGTSNGIRSGAGHAFLDTSHWVAPPTNATTKQPWHPQGWLDVIMQEDDEGNWAPLAVTEFEHRCPWPGVSWCLPGEEHSAQLTRLWCNQLRSRPSSKLIRLTYRQLTTLRYATGAMAESERAWALAPCAQARQGPNGLLFQSGMWDIESRIPAVLTRSLLTVALITLRSLGRPQNNSTHPRKVAYASLPMPWPQREDVSGEWQRSVVEEANSVTFGGDSGDGFAPQIAFFERIVDSATALSSSCKATCNLPNHPPHAINVPLVPLMLETWLRSGSARDNYHDGGSEDTPRRHSQVQPTSALATAWDWRMERKAILPQESPQCCCGRPPASLMERAAIDKTAYWAVLCPLTTPPGSSASIASPSTRGMVKH